MKSLKGILIFLVITLVIIIAVGGSMVGFNPSGHQMTTTSQKADSAKSSQNSPSSTESTGKSDQNQNNSSFSTMGQSGSVEHGVYGNQNLQMPMGPVVVAQAQVPPKEYLKEMQEAMGMIKDATGLMANAPYMNENTTPGTNQQMNSASTGVEMDKIHQGIYKMAQATTLMDQAMISMQKEVDKAQEKGLNGGYPVNPYINPYFNQVYPNTNQQNQNTNQSNQSGTTNNSQGQSDQTSMNSQDTGMSQMNHSASGMGFNFNLQSFTYLIYGILVLSLFGIVVAITGFIANLFKPAKAEEQRGESFVG